MSNPRVAALVCEGQTDVPILRTVIQKVWPGIEEVLTLQPALDALGRATSPAGWSQVEAWCRQHAGNLEEVLEPDIGDRIDLLLIAMDVDIAIEAGIEDPPAEVGAYESQRLRSAVGTWLLTKTRRKLPPEIVISTPVMAVEAWVISALFRKQAAPEQIRNPTEWLVLKKKLERYRKDGRPRKDLTRYQDFAKTIGGNLKRVRSSCGEADRTCTAIEQRRAAVDGL